ncbi:DUF5320 domain-containing protein [Anaerosalibacter massiliensis]|uniref:DUF5320 domain-containing protein n=1 Tax=Anaerosalibacter massiliensis TaxID=1347392 RepID=UPI0005B2819F|nr:DUF5320 domain-containing protein [Anaerosalibacter massiliensis]
MTGKNGTGPLREGSMTGRGMGVCGCGYGRRGKGFGYGMNLGDEKSFLQEMKGRLELRLKEVNKRLEEIE